MVILSDMLFRLLLLTSAATALLAQGVDYVRTHYTKYEYRVPMRDGKKLFTSVYLPKDQSQKYPILLNRTPYTVAPYGVDKYRENLGPSARFARETYIYVYQDVRGRWMSEGEFINMTPHKAAKNGPADVDESTDTYDTIDWLVKTLPNNNGRVGTYGISYPGFYTAAGMIDAHPAHVAASPQAPIVDWFTGDDFHRNGVLWLPHAFGFLSGFGRPRPEPVTPDDITRAPLKYGTPDGYSFYLKQIGPLYNANEKFYKNEVAFWNEMMKHDTYDAFWQGRNLRPHLKGIKPAVLTVGGWFDAENVYGALQVFENVEKNGPRSANLIAFGPWVHGGWARTDGDRLGDIRFNAKTSEYYREQVEFPFFEHYLKQKGEMKLAKATMFETGTNQWRKFEAWPPNAASTRSLYLRAGGRVAWDPPTESDGFEEYVSDPAKPVPFIANTAIGMTREYMTADQRFVASRPDVLVFESDVLDEDVTLAGPIVNELIVSTTGTDADWVVKVIDVYPNDFPDYESYEARVGGNSNPRNPATYVKMGGYQQLIRGEMFRGKFRNSFSQPEAFVPNRATPLKFTMNDVLHTFRRGHRIMIQIHSTWFPLADRNPQKFMNINEAKESDFQRATHRVYRSKAQASRIQLRVLAK